MYNLFFLEKQDVINSLFNLTQVGIIGKLALLLQSSSAKLYLDGDARFDPVPNVQKGEVLHNCVIITNNSFIKSRSFNKQLLYR